MQIMLRNLWWLVGLVLFQHQKTKQRKMVDGRCGRETRQRYSVSQKLHAVDHWHFARESGLEYNEAVIPSYKKRVSVCEGLHFLFV